VAPGAVHVVVVVDAASMLYDTHDIENSQVDSRAGRVGSTPAFDLIWSDLLYYVVSRTNKQEVYVPILIVIYSLL
jgi:hypothetical protein